MIEKFLSRITLRIMSGRSPKHYLPICEKERIANYVAKLLTYEYRKKVDSVWIGGSQSVHTPKFPSKTSDIDVYVICNSTHPIIVESRINNFTRLSLGHNISVYLIGVRYKEEVTKGMELIETKEYTNG